MASQVFPLAIITSPPANGIRLILRLVLVAPPARRRALATAISAPAALAMAAGGLTAAPREQPLERSAR